MQAVKQGADWNWSALVDDFSNFRRRAGASKAILEHLIIGEMAI